MARNQIIIKIDRSMRAVLGNEEYRFPILLTLSFRIGLSCWVAILWAMVDREVDLISNWGWIKGAYSGIYPHKSIIGRMMIDAWVHWDASHFLAIAKFGYQNLELGNLNYFPLFPIVTRVTGRMVFGDIALAGLLVTTASVVIAATLLYRLIIVIWNDDELARWSVLVWMIFPTSFFLFAPYSDALYICLTIGCFLMLRKKNWVISGILAGLAGMTRAQGVVMVAIIAYITIREGVVRGRTEFFRSLPALIIAPLGSLGYLLWRNTQAKAGLFETYNQFSGRSFSTVDPITAFYRAIMKLITTWDYYIFIDIFTIIFFGSILMGMLCQKKFRNEVDLTLYSVLTFASFLPWTSDLVSPYQSVTRYVVSLFPLFVVIASYLINVQRNERNWYVVVNLGLMIVCVSLYTLWIFVG